MTCNVSESGVLFETDARFSLGQTIDFSIVFGEDEPAYQYRVRCLGEVVRVEPRGSSRGVVAIKLHSYGL